MMMGSSGSYKMMKTMAKQFMGDDITRDEFVDFVQTQFQSVRVYKKLAIGMIIMGVPGILLFGFGFLMIGAGVVALLMMKKTSKKIDGLIEKAKNDPDFA
jgi:hypothetical protein